MLDFHFVDKGTFARLKPQKRIMHVFFGAALVVYFFWQLTVHETLLTTDFLLIPWSKWIGVAILFYFFSDVFNIGFNRRWGRWPQVVFLVMIGVAIGVDFILYDAFWGPPSGWLVYGMQQFTAAMLGIGFLASAVLASPG